MILHVTRFLFTLAIIAILWLRYDWFLALVLTGLSLSVEAQWWVMGAMYVKLNKRTNHETTPGRVYVGTPVVPRTKNPPETQAH